MPYSASCLILQRFVVPFVLTVAALMRPVGISFVYMFLFFLSPFVPLARPGNFKGSLLAFTIIHLTISVLLMLCHIILQTTAFLLDFGPSGTCAPTEYLLRHLGFIRFDSELSWWRILHWLLPEILMVPVALGTFLAVRSNTRVQQPLLIESGEIPVIASDMEDEQGFARPSRTPTPTTRTATRGQNENRTEERQRAGLTEEKQKSFLDRLILLSPIFCMMLLLCTSILRPSVPGGIYFLVFLCSGTYISTYRSLRVHFARFLRLVLLIIIVHALCIVLYQTPFLQTELPEDSLVARLIGLEPLLNSSCDGDIRIITIETKFGGDSFLNPIMLFIAYHVLALTSKNLAVRRIVPKPTTAFSQEIDSNNTNKIQRQISLITRTTGGSKKDSNWSKTQCLNLMHTKPPNHNRTPEIDRSSSAELRKSTYEFLRQSDRLPTRVDIGEQIIYTITSVASFIYRNSFIFTNVMMMAWSIIYHSWLTFALLLWANVLWMIPNQRMAMLRSSPFIVMYAELLLLLQYIYSMNLTDDELPSRLTSGGINLEQIGLQRPQNYDTPPYSALLVKTCFLLMFWITLRQFFKEKSETTRENTLGDIFSPIGDSTEMQRTKSTNIMKRIGEMIKNLFVRLWIWVLLFAIFMCAITGRHMTGFRICYMAMFLFFLLVFQTSPTAWLRIMYGFWLFLIFYAMFILILIYTYQFDKFDQYWEDYFQLTKTMQGPIGLEIYKTKDLFLHLLAPTCIVILTVIQVHYFHRRLVISMTVPAKIEKPERRRRSKSPIRPSLIRTFLKRVLYKLWIFYKNLKDISWRILELHWIKVVYGSAFFCAVSEQTILHLPFVMLCLQGSVLRTKVKIYLSRLVSLVVAIIVLSKMVYQVNVIDENIYNVSCPNDTETYNSAAWFGLKKQTEDQGLVSIIRKYIIYMIVATIQSIISIRQYQARRLKGLEKQPPPKFVFEGIKREDAEVNLPGMLKYLVNYGYYKFGFEMCLIALVALMTFRRDIIAMIYCTWLLVLLLIGRSKCSRLWRVFEIFIFVSLLVQYLVTLGLPPSLCLEYPWTELAYSGSLQKWTMLPGFLHHDHSDKLMMEYILLMMVSRQSHVYKLERQPNNQGGSNKSVVKDIQNLGKVNFHNPTHDFLSQIRNYLDVVKYTVLCGFFWITLGTVFLAGTKIADFFAIGYIIGACVFLWEGSDFYLRPINKILRRWRYLLAYNVANIVIKTSLQMGGCLFLNEITQVCCWCVHVFGINCAINNYMMVTEKDFVHGINECPFIPYQPILVWDAICFAFLIFQLRIFRSHYFCHIINETRANNILASRGFEIIERLRHKQIERRQQNEELVLQKIKRKMEKIRASHQKILRPLEKPTYYDEHGMPVYKKPPKVKEVKVHPRAMRSGDYYMFEDLEDKFELDLIPDTHDLADTDTENITQSDLKMNRRKTLYDESQKPKSKELDHTPTTATDGAGPSTSKAASKKSPTQPDEDATSASSADSDAIFKTNPVIRLFGGYFAALTIRLNRFSRNFRYVNKILTEEKRALKESKNFYVFRGRFDDKQTAEFIEMLRRASESSEDSQKMRGSAAYARNLAIASSSEQTLSPYTSSSRSRLTLEASSQTLRTEQMQTQTDKRHIEELIDEEEPKYVSRLTQTTSDLDSETASETSLDTQKPITSSFSETPMPSSQDVVASGKSLEDESRDQPQKPPRGRKSEPLPEIRIKAATTERRRRSSGSFIDKQWPQDEKLDSNEYAFEEDTFTSRDHHILIEVLISAWYAIISNTDIICYIVIFVHQIVEADLLALPLPLMVFMWGTLSLPRPTKTFWVTLIAYTQAAVLIKCIFQFKLIWINYAHTVSSSPLGIQELFGVEFDPNYAIYDLLVLLALFFHRFILKSHGLWKTDVVKTVIIDSKRLTTQDQTISPADEALFGDKEYDRRYGPSPPYGGPRFRYCNALLTFFHNLLHKSRLPSDIYAFMFFCDFINFFILLFGFTAFTSRQAEPGEEGGGVQSYLSENKVPVSFLIMLLVQFLLIIIDRVVYLRKALRVKIVFHYISVVGVHVWMFLLLPWVTARPFYSSAPPIIFYLFKCFYLLASAYQIKCGYPNRILGNFLTKSFTVLNMVVFKIYLLMPFLFELRTILDWLCIETTMTLFEWLKMEDMFALVYSYKCVRQMEADFPAPRATPKALYLKVMVGGVLFLVIVTLIWLPLILFALFNAVGEPNIPTEVSVSIRLGSFDPIYTATTRESTSPFDDAMFDKIKNLYAAERGAQSFLVGYNAPDVAVTKLSANSPSMWNIAPPDKKKLIADLTNSSNTLYIRFAYTITRKSPSRNELVTVSSEIVQGLNESYPDRKNMISMLEGNSSTHSVRVPLLVPKFIKVINTGDLSYIPMLLNGHQFRDLELSINTFGSTQWWEISDWCGDDDDTVILEQWPSFDCTSGVTIYTFNDKKFPSALTFLTAGGIIGLYTSIVIVASQFLKTILGGASLRIKFEDMPYVDRVLQLCLDVYLVREAKEFMLEEDVYAKLMFLFRSPETMVKVTRPRDDAEDETDTESVRSRGSGRRNEHPQPQQIVS
ncbi:piezo-type mechanosensitive ion channel component isoform X3 [Glossina fuscipes]|uniref:Piezo-type mechanosensitive ion channel component isoform X3 n=1 Tax=Glossina fuscipes TaxID=7396 RepID=A0A9C6DMN6_9MUSC|nr:piezo-type mechanosensitive ion channel component isoform X3 [Glossina fuscipes]